MQESHVHLFWDEKTPIEVEMVQFEPAGNFRDQLNNNRKFVPFRFF